MASVPELVFGSGEVGLRLVKSEGDLWTLTLSRLTEAMPIGLVERSADTRFDRGEPIAKLVFPSTDSAQHIIEILERIGKPTTGEWRRVIEVKTELISDD